MSAQRIFFHANAAEMLLTGVNTSQLISYFWHGERDGWINLLLLLTCYCASTAKTICGWIYLDSLMSRTAMYDPYGDLPDSVGVGVIFIRIPEVAFHAFLLRRVYTVSGKNKIIALIGIVLWLTQLAASIGVAVFRFQLNSMISYIAASSRAGGFWLPFWAFSLMACDVFLASTFCFYILRSQRGILNARLGRALRSLVSVAVQSAAPTATISLVMAILYITRQPCWLIFQFMLPPLYTTTFLATLNARTRIRTATAAQEEDVDWVQMAVADLEGGRGRAAGVGGRDGGGEGAVEEKARAGGQGVEVRRKRSGTDTRVSFSAMLSGLGIASGERGEGGGTGSKNGKRHGVGSGGVAGMVSCEVEVEETSEKMEPLEVSADLEYREGSSGGGPVTPASRYVESWT